MVQEQEKNITCVHVNYNNSHNIHSIVLVQFHMCVCVFVCVRACTYVQQILQDTHIVYMSARICTVHDAEHTRVYCVAPVICID